ncbi:hypothetical protein QUW47_09270 [Phocaeicola barnesiae]|uniref:fimbrial tip adhesin FimD n=1 Tax=Phocaeicola barnesiae TaxID=376804 RepID=UPI0025A449CB|nr:fimbrial protein [Phocaeicola barnesiae]MDM8242070.1 hypothetical protein [Phocaeicola barnesiae]
MKTNQMIWNIGRYMCLAVLVALASCTRDEWTESVNTPQEEGLCFSLYADGDMKPAGTRSPEGDDLNENLISSVDIFLFKQDGTLNAGGYVHAESDEVVYLYKGSEWLNNFSEQDAPYTVYALANYKGDATLSGVQSLDDLKAVVAEDVDVVKWEGMDGYNGKTFLMDGNKSVAYTDLQSAQSDGEPYIVQMPLTRAAVKIELTLNFSDEWAQKFMATGLKAQLSNYASITPALSDGNPLDGDQRGLSNYPGLQGDEMENFSVAPVFDKGQAFKGSKIRFYTYINRWDDFIDNETMLLIDLPGRYDENGNPASEDAELLDHNFYKVPIISNAEPQIFQRNTFYQITAEVNMKGTATVDVPVVLTNVQFQTAYWKVNDVDGGDADADYLMLNQYYVDIRNVDSYDVEFYSSSPIASVEIVGFENQNEAQTAGIDFAYPGEGTEIPGVYFVDKNNQRRDVSKDNLVAVDWDKDVVNGKIHLDSPNPDNVTKRYITLKVTNTDGLSKYVVVEQYPLEYIQPIPGYYSYRDDCLTWNAYNMQEAIHYERKMYYTSGVTLFYKDDWCYKFDEEESEKMEFESKVFINDKVLKYTFDTYKPGTYVYPDGTEIQAYVWTAKAVEGSSVGLDNNMMYSVTISQTDERYKIAYPLRTLGNFVFGYNHPYDTTISSEENDKLISPNFTLASHLGYVNSTNKNANFWAFAELHCGVYVETYQNEEGKTVVLDNWRLPTSAEIEVILRYQNDPKAQEVMDEVLTEDYYYVCWEGAMGGKGVALNPNGNGNGLKAVRCVRDLLPEEKFQNNQ